MSLRDDYGFDKIRQAFPEGTPPNYTVHGKILKCESVHAREYSRDPSVPGDLMYYKDGKPKMNVVVTIDTGVKGHDGPEDDGRRKVYIRTYYPSDRAAMLAALDQAGDDDFQVGGQFAAVFLGKLIGDDGKEQAWNSQRFEYRKPSAIASVLGQQTPPADMGVGGAPGAVNAHAAGSSPNPAPGALFPQAPVSVPVSVPVSAPPVEDPAEVARRILAAQQAAAAPVPAPTPLDPATAAAVRSLIAAGIDDATIRGAYPAVSPVQLVAIRNLPA